MIAYCQSIQRDYDFVLVAAISPYEETRQKARQTFGHDYLEIFLFCPLEVLMKRDVKNLYAKALDGQIKNLIGFSPESPYETPSQCDLKIDTSQVDQETALKMIINLIDNRFPLKN